MTDGASHTVYDHDGAQTDQYDYSDRMPYQLTGFRTRFTNLRLPANEGDSNIEIAVRRMTRNLSYALRAYIVFRMHRTRFWMTSTDFV